MKSATSRAMCRLCGVNINAGELKVETKAKFPNDKYRSSNVHFACFKLPQGPRPLERTEWWSKTQSDQGVVVEMRPMYVVDNPSTIDTEDLLLVHHYFDESSPGESVEDFQCKVENESGAKGKSRVNQDSEEDE